MMKSVKKRNKNVNWTEVIFGLLVGLLAILSTISFGVYTVIKLLEAGK